MRRDILQQGEAARRADKKGASRIWIGLAVLLLLGNLGWYVTWNNQVQAQQVQAQTMLTADMAEAAEQAARVVADPADTQAYYRTAAALRGASEALQQLAVEAETTGAQALWDALLAKPEAGVQQMAVVQQGAAKLAQDWNSVEGYQLLAAANAALTAAGEIG